MTPRPDSLLDRHRADVAVCVAFVIVWTVFDRLAALLGSTRGEEGAVVCIVVLALLVGFERLRGHPPKDALRSLGLRSTRTRALCLALALSGALLAFFPTYALATGTKIRWHAAWPALAAGMWLQGGVAEEALFRGLVFRHFRKNREFWPAAWLAAIPFTLVHLSLFLSLDAVVAASALALSLAISFPLAWLFDRSGGSIWPGSLLHAAVQAPIKLAVIDSADAFAALSIAWMMLCATLPWLAFLLRGHGRHSA